MSSTATRRTIPPAHPATASCASRDGTTPLIATTGGADPRHLQRRHDPDRRERPRDDPRRRRSAARCRRPIPGKLFGHENNFVFGGSIDHANVDFQSSTEVGVINSSLQVLPSGFFVDTPENTGFNATPVEPERDQQLLRHLRHRYLQPDAGPRRHRERPLQHRRDRLWPITSARTSPATTATAGSIRRSAAPTRSPTGLTAYAGYSEGNRAPTPSEIECSNPAQPCLLALLAVLGPAGAEASGLAHLRGGAARQLHAARHGSRQVQLEFRAVPHRSLDDIYGVATSISSGFFENIGSTRRQGIEAGLTYKDEKWSVYGSYSLVDATFQSPLTLPSPNNPFADANGNIHVVPGDRLPGIPEHRLKVGADYRITPEWTVGGVLTYYSDQYLRGDESNQNPPLPGYAVVNLHTSYRVTENFELFANLQNALNARYATFGGVRRSDRGRRARNSRRRGHQRPRRRQPVSRPRPADRHIRRGSRALLACRGPKPISSAPISIRARRAFPTAG